MSKGPAICDCTACIHSEVRERRRCTKTGFWTGDRVMNCPWFKRVKDQQP